MIAREKPSSYVEIKDVIVKK